MADVNVVLNLLQGTLSADSNVRIRSELDLTRCAEEKGMALFLTTILTSPAYALELRQAAGFLLKKLVKEHWSSFFSSFRDPEISGDVKQEVRRTIVSSLSDPVQKIRGVGALIISEIAHPDWPDEWPSLTQELMTLLSSPKVLSVDGAMRVLLQFVGIDLSEDQLIPLSQELVPLLLRIASDAQHSPLTRAAAVHVFRQCVLVLFTVKDIYPEQVKAAVGVYLPPWISFLEGILGVGLSSQLTRTSWASLALRGAAVSVFDTLLQSFPSTIRSSTNTLLEIAARDLHALVSVYRNAYVLEEPPENAEEGVDVPPPTDDDEGSYSVSFASVSSDVAEYVAGLFVFIGQAVRKKSTRPVFFDTDATTGVAQANVTFQTLLGDLVRYSEMTAETEDEWLENADTFVAEDEEDEFGDSTRANAADLLVALVDFVGAPATISTLWTAFLGVGNDATLQQQPAAWKTYEAGLFLLSSIYSDAVENSTALDLRLLFSDIVPRLLGQKEHPFLVGRCFVLASQFWETLPNEMASTYIESAIAAMGNSEHVALQLSAIRALRNFFTHLKTEPSMALDFLRFTASLLPSVSDATLTLVIESINAALLVCGPSISAEDGNRLMDTVLEAWTTSIKDPYLRMAVEGLFGDLAGPKVNNAHLQHSLIVRGLPSLAQLLLTRDSDGTYDSPLSSGAALLIDSILKALPAPVVEAHPQTLSLFADSLFTVLGSTSDRDTIQTAFTILTSVVRKDVSQLLAYQSSGSGSGSGENGLQLVLALLSRFVIENAPSNADDVSASVSAESGGLFVGDLVLHLLRRAGGQLSPEVLVGLVSAFVVRLSTSRTVAFTQSLLTPLAYLVYTQNADDVLRHIEGLSVTYEGQTTSGLVVLLRRWTDAADAIQGFWDNKISILALTRVFLSSLPSLDTLAVNGALIPDDDSRIKTRSRARKNPDRYVQIPVRAKIAKLLLAEVRSNVEYNEKRGGGQSKVVQEDEEEDDEWADEEFEDNLESMLEALGGTQRYTDDGDWDGFNDRYEEDEDEDLKEDPIYTTDTVAYLGEFFRHVNGKDLEALAAGYLDESERRELSGLVGGV